ncbi:helix-turn-helix transcriptional regulator [Nocardia sp. NPDC088792]|uniref:helix-turn-helix transcriptional regulator n=1 Tax=Nocardia sp. NPDC088792 TaxID=3364332 RepID=UPI003830BABC
MSATITIAASRVVIHDNTTAEPVIMQVDRDMLRERSGLDEDSFHRLSRTPLVLAENGAAAVVAQFFRAIAAIQHEHPIDAAALTVHAVDLLATVLSLASGKHGLDGIASLHARERVLTFLNHNFTDPTLTVERVARSCAISRSTLYRLMETDGGVGALLRRMRIAHARRLLTTGRTRSIAAIAVECGFTTDRQFYRAFRAETGQTPGEYRTTRIG